MNKQQVIEAFENGRKAQGGNYFSDGLSLYLFGNKIAEHREGDIYFSLAGWNTTTTKQALNHLNNVSIHSSKGVIKNFDSIINKNDWYKVSDF